METQAVKIQDLPPMRVASFIGFGNSPELPSLNKMIAWAKPKGLLDSPNLPRIFGFNNPDPSPGSPNYGYETWLVIPPDMVVDDDTIVKEIPAMKCATLHCPSVEVIMQHWHHLVTWVETSPYRTVGERCLEETFFKGFEPPTLDHFLLWLPVKE